MTATQRSFAEAVARELCLLSGTDPDAQVVPNRLLPYCAGGRAYDVQTQSAWTLFERDAHDAIHVMEKLGIAVPSVHTSIKKDPGL